MMATPPKKLVRQCEDGWWFTVKWTTETKDPFGGTILSSYSYDSPIHPTRTVCNKAASAYVKRVKAKC